MTITHHPINPQHPPPPSFRQLQQNRDVPSEAHGHHRGMSGDEAGLNQNCSLRGVHLCQGRVEHPPTPQISEIHKAGVLVVADNNRHMNNPATCSNNPNLRLKQCCGTAAKVLVYEGLSSGQLRNFVGA